jgi:co-chaperonin GroES (HSP10)
MIKVVGHRVLVKPEKLEEVDPVYKSANRAGIVIPKGHDTERAEMSIDKGMVLDIGATAFKDFGGDAWCKVGDIVYFARHAGKRIKDKEEFVVVLNDEDIVCIEVKDE